MADICIISGATEKLVQVIVDGKSYYVSEEISDSCSLKALSEQIRTKLTEKDSKKALVAAGIEAMAKQLNLPVDEIIRMFGGGAPAPAVVVVEEEEQPRPAMIQMKKSGGDDGFKSVSGDLSTSVKAKVNADSKIGSAMPAYSSPTIDGKRVMETNKRVRVDRDNDTVITKSDMGTTVVRVTRTDGDRLSKELCRVDPQTGDLIRGSAISKEGNRECPMCQGTGLARVNSKECPKCQGIGFIV